MTIHGTGRPGRSNLNAIRARSRGGESQLSRVGRRDFDAIAQQHRARAGGQRGPEASDTVPSTERQHVAHPKHRRPRASPGSRPTRVRRWHRWRYRRGPHASRRGADGHPERHRRSAARRAGPARRTSRSSSRRTQRRRTGTRESPTGSPPRVRPRQPPCASCPASPTIVRAAPISSQRASVDDRTILERRQCRARPQEGVEGDARQAHAGLVAPTAIEVHPLEARHRHVPVGPRELGLGGIGVRDHRHAAEPHHVLDDGTPLPRRADTARPACRAR